MTLGIRKLIVAGLIGAVFLIANFLIVADWLQAGGLIGWAQGIRREYLTGTAITILVALLILLVRSGGRPLPTARRCPVCDRRVRRSASYCSDCGSRL